ncbi:MAG: phospholipase, partial [Proteobacteria bacterium]|nr:phospholipase [Pseudomonadota bacterium]
LAAGYVTSPACPLRTPGAAATLLRWMADGEPDRFGDLLAYMLFDCGFTTQLVELGRADGRAHHDALCALFESARGVQSAAV